MATFENNNGLTNFESEADDSRNKRLSERFETSGVWCDLGEVVEMSSTGIRLRCNGKPVVEPGGLSVITLSFGDGRIEVKSQVRWRKRRSLKRYEIGLKFYDVQPEDVQVLATVAEHGSLSVGAAASATEIAAHQHRPSQPVHVATRVPNYYHILGVAADATSSDIRSHYRRMAHKWDPKRNDDADASMRFEEVQEAYRVLSDPLRRESFDHRWAG